MSCRLTRSQIGWCIIGSVAITIVARLIAGWLCDRIGPRLTYTWVLILGSLPVMGIGLAHNFETFLLFRVLIGAYRRVLRHNAVSHVGDVRAQLRGHGQRGHGGLG